MEQNHSWQETVILPIGYSDEKNGTVIKEATLRKMTGKEEALLADPKLRGNGGKLITALLANCVLSMGEIDKITPLVIRRLFSGDRNYLLLELRRLTFGDEMEANYHCPRCQRVTTIIENLEEIEVRQVENGEMDQEVEITLKDGYCDPDGNWQHEFSFRFPNGDDEEISQNRRDSNPSSQRNALLTRCLLRVGDLEERRVNAIGVRILSDLSMSDRRLIQKALDERAPGPDLTRMVICDHCGEEYRTTLDMSHFFPLA